MKSARDQLRAELQKAREDIANATSVTQYDRAKKRAAYLAALAQQSAAWIRASHDNPNAYMTPACLRLHRLALRRMGAL